MGVTLCENPAWDYIDKVPDDDLLAQYAPQATRQFTMTEIAEGDELKFHRSYVTCRWTWAIPSPDAIEFIVKILDGRPVVEMGAGNGYWAWMLSQHGVDVNAYDRAPVGHEGSWYEPEALAPYDVEPEQFHPVTKAEIEALELPENANRVLFLCWPSYGSSFAYDCAKTFKGDTIIYIGEGPGGCTADWDFWTLVEGEEPWASDDLTGNTKIAQEWERESVHLMPQWAGIHDRICVYRRIK